MIGNTLFEYKMAVSVFKVEIKILKQTEKSALHLFSCYRNERYNKKHPRIRCTPINLKYLKWRPRGETSTFNYKLRNDMPSEAWLENFKM